jgi:hypothetical protein
VEIDLSPFVNAGVAGMILVWFMFRLERILTRFDNKKHSIARLATNRSPHYLRP